MDNEPKKISFGFNKLMKKPNIIIKQPVEEKKCEIIEYIEEKAIKVIGGNDTPKGPLVIPMKESNKTKLMNLIEIVQNNFQDIDPQTQSNSENSNIESESNKSENLSLEEQAAQELLNDTKKSIKVTEESKRIIDVKKNEEKPTFEGEKESTLEDYEEIPIQEFGKAMLRGMGWKDGQGIGKNQQLIKMAQPIQRPKGMGLGADKMAKQDKNDKPAVDKDGNTLKCVKGCYVKIIAGYHKGNYGQIVGLDDESGRFIVKTALNNLNLSLNEFLVSPVTKDEYVKNSKVINNAKYEEYLQKKENEEKRKLEQIKKEKKSHDERKDRRKSYSSDEEHKSRKNKYEETKTVKKERRYSDSEEEIKKERIKEKREKKVKSEKSKYDSEDETTSKKHKNKYKTKSKHSSDSEDNRKSRSEKSKYNSDEESRDRKNRDRHKSSKYASDSEEDPRTSKKKSSKYESDSEDYEQSRKKHKKKKSKKYSSDEETDDRYKKSSKKKEKKYESDSEDERDKKKKHKEKRNRSRHDRR